MLDHARHCCHGGFGSDANVTFAPSFLLSVSLSTVLLLA